jgi:divalent metal cation (Fe/Co/Zn/Cd) transporter
VERVNRALTMYFGPHTVLLAMDLHFRDNLSATEIEQTVDRLESAIRDHHQDIKHVFIESDSLLSAAKSRTRGTISVNVANP